MIWNYTKSNNYVFNRDGSVWWRKLMFKFRCDNMGNDFRAKILLRTIVAKI